MIHPLERAANLFAEALPLSEAERHCFLARECGGEESLQARLEALLRAHDDGGFPEYSPGAELTDAHLEALGAALADEFIGTRIGRYWLLRKIGEGGRGDIYMAEQEEPIRRRLALKMIKPGKDAQQVVARFEEESQALALMDHPNIVPVFGCGISDGGRAYFVTELVQGLWITRFCDGRRMHPSERLELFVPICLAIQHAHEKGILHRDLKPSNVLVALRNGKPTPKVTDFGVAMATEAWLAEKTLLPTSAPPIGTPIYLSPEQAELGRAAIDARSDVYSLGVLLYELLTGCTPFDARGLAKAGFDEIRRRVRKEQPLLPSIRVASLPVETLASVSRQRQVDPPKLIRLLRADLDWIVMRCLEKNPSHRYPTVAALAEDIAHHLRYEPVVATAPNFATSLRWFARRRRRRLQATGLAASLAIAGAGGWIGWMEWKGSRVKRVERGWKGESLESVAKTEKGEKTAPSAPAPAVSPQSIAVLPFENLSPDPDNAFFTEGVHEDLINNLAKIHDLTVASRSSVLAYPTGARNLRSIASELQVANLLEGSVRRTGNRVRVTARLVDARTDRPIWADTYDENLTDTFAIQGRLTKKIAETLQANLTPGERQLIGRRPTSNQDAYDLYLRARAIDEGLGGNGSLPQYEPVVSLYQQSVAKDPNFALAYAQLSQVDINLYWYADLDPTPARLALAKAASDAASRLAPKEPETMLALGHLAYGESRDWKKALQDFKAAEEGLPNDDQVIFSIGFTLRHLGSWDESATYLQRSSALNSQSIAESVATLQTLAWLRRYSQAADAARHYQALYPDDRNVAEILAATQYEIDGDREEFLRARDALPVDPQNPLHILDHYQAAADRGDWPAADRALADPRIDHFLDSSRVVINPLSLERAKVAFLRGDPEAARTFADQAIKFYRGRTWVDRQRPWVALRCAQAEVYAGRMDEGLHDADAAWSDVATRDAVDAMWMQPPLGEIYIIAGHRPDALAILRKMMSGPCDWGPQKLRHDPIWSRLADDPLFEQILKSGEPL